MWGLQVAKTAAFGNGIPIKVDEAVGKTWQIEASKVTLQNRRWPAALRSLTEQVAEELGCYGSDYMDALLDKLVLCEVGGSFEAHNDMEKEPGVFATMVRGIVGSICVAQPRLPRKALMSLCLARSGYSISHRVRGRCHHCQAQGSSP